MRKIQNFIGNTTLGKIISFLIIVLTSSVTPLLGVIFWLNWRWLLKKPFIDFGLKKPKNIFKLIIIGVSVGIGLKFVFKAIIMPLFSGATKNNSFQFLEGNLMASLGLALFALISAGLCEEIIYRGYLFHKLKSLLGETKNKMIIVVLLSSLIFGLPHLYQGLSGAIQATLIGVLFGYIYIKNNYNLWLLVVIHASFDLFSIFLIYNNYEEYIARVFFN
nr:CPBP family intramembrane glutamic endopeptidase [uncultured Psychroserpens sp.]